MKTAGQLLLEKRLLLELSLDQVANKTKVKKDYLIAIEQSDFAKLPSAPVTKGFLKSYAKILHLNPDTLLAMYRRDYDEVMNEIIPHGLVAPITQRTHLFTIPIILTTISLLTFGIFLLSQLISWWSLPQLVLLSPLDSETYTELVTVKGTTDPDANVFIGDQAVLVNQDGEFNLDLRYPTGIHRLVVKAIARDGKTRLLERSFSVSK